MSAAALIARKFIQSRLEDTQSGFNYWYKQTAGAPPFSLNAAALLLSLNSDPAKGAQTLWPGNYATPELIMVRAPAAASMPFVSVFSERTINTPPKVTPSKFSGAVRVMVDFFLGSNVAQITDLETWADAVESAMLDTFNGYDYYTLPQQFANSLGLTVPVGMTYNNEMDNLRGPVMAEAQLQIQVIRFVIVHHIYLGG